MRHRGGFRERRHQVADLRPKRDQQLLLERAVAGLQRRGPLGLAGDVGGLVRCYGHALRHGNLAIVSLTPAARAQARGELPQALQSSFQQDTFFCYEE
jgi:hypothetical protein